MRLGVLQSCVVRCDVVLCVDEWLAAACVVVVLHCVAEWGESECVAE